MDDKKKKVIELLAFAVVLVALLLHYGLNRNNSKEKTEGNNIEVSQTASPEMNQTPQVQKTDQEAQNEEKGNNAGEAEMPDIKSDSNAVVAAKADEYYDSLNNSDGTQSYEIPAETPKIEVIDGIEVIQNPPKGVQ